MNFELKALALPQAANHPADVLVLLVPDAFKALTISDLQNLKTPWGLTYLGFAQACGTLWGLT